MLKQYFSEARQTLWLALPFIANQILQMSVVTIDSLMAGADSNLTLAAISQGTILWHLVMLGIIGLLMPMTAMVAKAYARKDAVQLRQLFQQSMWLALPLGLLGFMAMWWIPKMMTLIGVDAEIVPPATDYLRIIAFTIPLIALFLPVRFLTEGIGFPKAMMVLTATSVPINIIGNYVLLNGLMGLPKMGASGIAVATLIAELYLLCAGWWFALHHPRMKPLALLRGFAKPLKPTIQRFFQLGVPNALALLMEAGMFTVVILLSGKLGVETAAANQIAINYASNTFMIPLGISMALTTRIGMAMGTDNSAKARIVGLSGMSLGAGFMLLSVMAITLLGRHIAGFYTEEPSVIDIATGLLALAGVFQIFDGIQVCAAGSLRGLEETQAPMRYAGIGYWLLGIPCAIVLAFPLGMGAQGLWWGLVVGLSTTAILSARKFFLLTTVT